MDHLMKVRFKKGEQTAATTSGKGLDPVGKEDGDVDNDGDKDKSDKYLLKRRSAIGKIMASRNEEVEQINEKPGDGYIGGTGIPWGGKGLHM